MSQEFPPADSLFVLISNFVAFLVTWISLLVNFVSLQYAARIKLCPPTFAEKIPLASTVASLALLPSITHRSTLSLQFPSKVYFTSDNALILLAPEIVPPFGVKFPIFKTNVGFSESTSSNVDVIFPSVYIPELSLMLPSFML